MGAPRILVIRMGAMGDVIHALPAVATLKHSFPHSWLAWLIEPKWAPLVEGNPFVDDLILLDRSRLAGLLEARRRLRAGRFDVAVDFQGLIKSAVAASVARPERIWGFHHSQLRERLAALFYSNSLVARAAHVVDRNLELAAAAGASSILHSFPLPPGIAEGDLPEGNFILACPLGGWPGKQWPLDNYAELALLVDRDLGLPLVLNGPPQAAAPLRRMAGTWLHTSSVAGLIHATRRATGVVGIDSGPLHLAAALGKPGVALYGPTDPARNGPYGDTITVLRGPDAVTSYKRRSQTGECMRQITPAAVCEALKARIRCRATSAGCQA